MPTDHEALAQQAAMEHLAACQDALFAEEGEELDVAAGTPAIAPYCGCDTCIVREVLHAAWPHMLELAREEVGA